LYFLSVHASYGEEKGAMALCVSCLSVVAVMTSYAAQAVWFLSALPLSPLSLHLVIGI